LAQVVRPTPTPRIVSDPDDDVVIGTALAAKADLLVTGDQPLLSVGKYQGCEDRRCCQGAGIDRGAISHL